MTTGVEKFVVSLNDCNNLILSDEIYMNKIKSLENEIKEDVHNSELIDEDMPNSKISKGPLLTMLCLAKPLNEFKEPLRKELLFPYHEIDKFNDYFDSVIEIISEKYTGIEEQMKLNQSISWALDELSIFSSNNVILQRGITVNPFNITNLSKKNDVFRETLHYRHKDNVDGEISIVDIEDLIKDQERNQRLSKEQILEDEGNPIRILFKAGSGINENQFAEVVNVIGFKPDIRGKVITDPIDTSFAEGLKTVRDYYTNATGGRKALITSKTQVRQSGYLNRKITVLTEDLRIDLNTDDCKNHEYVYINIIDKDHLKLFEDRYWVTNPSDEGEHILKRITSDNEDLIGKTIAIKSPITCGLKKKGNHICKKCYGDLWKTNLTKNIGTIANLILTEPMTQKLLSTKHLLKVAVKNFEWSNEFKDNFIISGSKIIPIDISEKIYIDEADIYERENYNVNRYTTDKFYIIDQKTKEKIYIEAPVRLILPDKYFQDISIFYNQEIEAYEYSLSDLNDDCDHIFTITVNNSGVAEPLLRIKNGLENNYYIQKDCNEDYNESLQGFLKLLIESKTKIQSIHLECILSCMTVFDKEGNHRIYNISDAIYYSNSPVKSFMYQYNAKQLETDSFNDLLNKTGNSEFDRLFIPVED